MKLHRLIPAVIAMVIFLGTPFSHVLTRSCDPRGGLVCYCCSSLGEKCAMLSCSGCCGTRAGDMIERWSPEMVLEIIQPPIPLPMALPMVQLFPTPESAFLEIPHAPPRTL
jgi:hypothetical protein